MKFKPNETDRVINERAERYAEAIKNIFNDKSGVPDDYKTNDEVIAMISGMGAFFNTILNGKKCEDLIDVIACMNRSVNSKCVETARREQMEGEDHVDGVC